MLSNSISQRPNIVPIVNDRARSDLLNGKRNKCIQLTFGVDVVTTTLLTGAIRNRGSVLALFPEIGVAEGGNDKALADARLFGIVSEAFRPSAGTATRLTSLAVGTTKLRETVRIFFENPFSANPRETQFMEHNIQAALQFFAKYSGDISRIVDVGTGAATLQNPFVRVSQVFDEDEAALPYFVPQYEVLTAPIALAQAALEIKLGIGDYIRGLTIMQDTQGIGEVSDIISTLQLRGDKRFWIGADGPCNYEDLARGMEFDVGGSVYASPNGAYLHLNFQEQGRLSKILSPAQDTNLRLVLGVAPSAAAGAVASYVRVLVHKLVRDPYVSPTGRTVVNPTLPIPV